LATTTDVTALIARLQGPGGHLPPARAHARCYPRHGKVDERRDVRVDDSLDVLGRHVGHRTNEPESRVVDEHVDPFKPVDCRSHQGRPIRRLPQITLHRDQTRKLRRHHVKALPVPRATDHGRNSGEEIASQDAADSQVTPVTTATRPVSVLIIAHPEPSRDPTAPHPSGRP